MTFAVKDICKRYGVGEHTVLGWIRIGDLKALNVGRSIGKKKPRFRITPEALAAFEMLRSTSPPLPQSRRRKKSPDVIAFYQ